MRTFDQRDGLAGLEVWAVHETDDGALWVGGNHGLHYVPSSIVRGAPPSIGGGESGSTTARFATNRIIALTTVHGLAENAVNWILDDGLGHFWLSGLRGIHRVSRADLEAAVRGAARQVRCATFGTADGLENPETNGEQQPAGCVDAAGRLWFSTIAGVVVIDPRAANQSEHPPAVVIEQVVADGKMVPLVANPSNTVPSVTAQLEPGRARWLRVAFTAPTFVTAERARFRHRLRGLSDEWEDAGAERVAYFTNLKPGEYVFEVTACNAHGLWQEAPARFTFSLVPKFTQTPWFPASLIAGGLLLAAAFVNWRLRWHRRALRAEGTASLANERTRIARDLHDDLGTALTELALELDVLRRESPREATLAAKLGESTSRVRALAERMREVVWVVNPRCDTVSSLASFLEQQAGQFLKADGLRCRLDFPEDIPPLPLDGETRHQLALGVREALSNAVRHSGASELALSLVIEPEALVVRVQDNGCGFHLAEVAERGHGLTSLRARMEKISGTLICRTAPGEGTAIEFRVPLHPKTTGPKEKR